MYSSLTQMDKHTLKTDCWLAFNGNEPIWPTIHL